MSDKNGEPDRRVKRTRQMIRNAMISLMKVKGFESITVHEIAERADVNRSTFYFHYQDKYDLLEQSNEEMLLAFTAALQPLKEAQGEICELSVEESTVKHLEHIAQNAVYYRVMLRGIGVPDFAQRMKLAIGEAFYQRMEIVAADEQGAKLPREILCAYVASAHFGAIEWWLENDLSYSPSYIANILNQLVMCGPFRAAKQVESGKYGVSK